jgi:hypothetical protein
MVSLLNPRLNKFSGPTALNQQGIYTSTSNTARIGQQPPTLGPSLPDLSPSYYSSLAQPNPLGQEQQQPQHKYGASNIPNSPFFGQQTQQRGERAHGAEVFPLTFANRSA